MGDLQVEGLVTGPLHQVPERGPRAADGPLQEESIDDEGLVELSTRNGKSYVGFHRKADLELATNAIFH